MRSWRLAARRDVVQRLDRPPVAGGRLDAERALDPLGELRAADPVRSL
jgi:hypothetical protein